MQQAVMPGLRGARSGGLDSSHYSSSGAGGEQEAVAAKGKGPRIYVGGIPTAVSETMVRGHFNQWGQVLPPPAQRVACVARRRLLCWNGLKGPEANDRRKCVAPVQQCTMPCPNQAAWLAGRRRLLSDGQGNQPAQELLFRDVCHPAGKLQLCLPCVLCAAGAVGKATA